MKSFHNVYMYIKSSCCFILKYLKIVIVNYLNKAGKIRRGREKGRKKGKEGRRKERRKERRRVGGISKSQFFFQLPSLFFLLSISLISVIHLISSFPFSLFFFFGPIIFFIFLLLHSNSDSHLTSRFFY